MFPKPTFIVRLYREACQPIAGVVEDVRTGRRTLFGNSEELWNALSANFHRSGKRLEQPKPERGEVTCVLPDR
jgi:hypothetical protein